MDGWSQSPIVRCVLFVLGDTLPEVQSHARSNLVFLVQPRRIPSRRESAWRPGRSLIR